MAARGPSVRNRERKVDTGNSFKGFVLLGGFLALDGLTSTFQEKLFKEWLGLGTPAGVEGQ